MTRILIAEDDRRGRYLLETLLKAYGYEVTSAQNGAEALGLARKQPPDVIVTDILMPVMDGFELCRQWKSDEKLKRIPFVFYTATYSSPNDEQFALSLGADRFILKPQEPEELAKIVHDLLEEHQKTAPAVREPLQGEAKNLQEYNAVLFGKLEKKVKELQESETRYRLLAELTSDFTYAIRVEPDGTPVLEECSDAFAKVTGYTKEELRTKENWARLVHPDDRARFAERQRVLLQGQGQVTEFRIVTKGGEIRWVLDYCRAEWDEAGTRVTHIFGASQDVTDRKELEKALALRLRVDDIFLTVPNDEMFNEVLKVVLDVLHSPFGVFGYLDEAGDFVVPTMTRQVWDKCRISSKKILFPRDTWGDSSWPRAIREKKPNYSNETSRKVPDGHVAIHRHISVPILFGEETIGLFLVANKETDYTEADVCVLKSVAAHVAPILNARLKDKYATEKGVKSELAWTATFNAMSDWVSLIAPDGRILRSNESAKELIGVSSEQIVGQTCFTLVHGPHARSDNCPALKMAGSGRREMEEFQTPDGKRWIQVTVDPIKDGNGNVTAAVHSVRDVTEYKNTEKALQDSLHNVRALLDQTFEFIGMLTPEGIVTEANQASLDASGIKKSDVIGKPFWEGPWWKHSPKLQGQLRAAVKTAAAGEFVRFEATHPAPDGSLLNVDFSLKPVKDENGRVTMLIPEGRDMTEHRRATRALHDSERFLTTIVENIPDMIFVKDAKDLRFVRLNKAGEDLLGYGREELVGKNDYDLFPKDEADSFLAKDREVLREGRLMDIPEETIRTRHLGERLLHTKKIPIFDEWGTPRYLLGISEDVTERKRREEQIRAMMKMDAVGQLAGGVAHDFNNLLTVINSYSALAIESLPPGDPLRADLEEILKAGERGAGLTKQLLAFSRKQVFRPETLNLDGLVAEMQEMLRRLVHESVTLKTRIAPDLGIVRADRSQVQQVVMNLVVNAKDSMPGGGTLTIETANVDLDEEHADHGVQIAPGPYVMLAISDTGGGMNEETKKHLFEPFFTTKETGKGTGLGLATVYGIVKQSNGYIWAYSEPGKGSTFKVYFPRDLSGSEAVARAVKKPVRFTGTETVLVVEDEESVRKIAHRVLTKAGYRVLTAADGGEALLACGKSKTPIDLLLTDVVMPKMSGRELARELTEFHPKIRVVYMSGYTQDVITHHGVLDPGARLIEKPFAAADLTRTVREVLDAPAEKVS